MSSSPEIFLYGGHVGDGLYDVSSTSQKINAGLDEVYILSLPSFVWFKANYTASDPRMLHTCNIVGNRQMLSIGGLDPSAPSLGAAHNDTDSFWEGIKVLDLTALQWTNHYNATAAPYTAPSAVAAHYATGSRYPSRWSSSELKSLFVKPASDSSTPVEPSASALPQPGTVNATNHRAVAIGGTIGAVAAVAIVGLALYLLTRKRAHRKNSKQEVSELPSTYNCGEPNFTKGFFGSGQAPAYEADSRPIPPQGAGLGQTLPHELGPVSCSELSGEIRVVHNNVNEM